MSMYLECKKLKRTGFLTAFLMGSLLTFAFPIVNMTLRSEIYRKLSGRSEAILLEANWQTMAMLNVLMIVIGACVIYHVEYEDHAIEKMDALPIRPNHLFFSKCAVMAAALAAMTVLETAALQFCAMHWFPDGDGFRWLLIENGAYTFVLAVPALILMVAISSACRNMWISLGIGVIAVFLTSIIGNTDSILRFFPVSMPFQTCIQKDDTISMLLAAGIEAMIFGTVGAVYQKVRRNLQ